jgi:hypothetical protein
MNQEAKFAAKINGISENIYEIPCSYGYSNYLVVGQLAIGQL